MFDYWNAKWITDRTFYGKSTINIYKKELSEKKITEHVDIYKNHHMLVRRILSIEKEFQNAQVYISADDYYKLYINDSFVGQGPAQSYHFHYNYNCYDITNYLKQGENIIAVHVYYQGEINRAYTSGDLRQGMIAAIIVDGSLELITDDMWKCKTAHEFTSLETIGYKTQFVEDIDQRLKVVGWRSLKFDDTDWEMTIINESDDHILYEQITPPLQIYEMSMQTITKKAKGHVLIDFGKEIVGHLSMKAYGKSGKQIEIRYGEEMDDAQSSVRYEMRCSTIYKDIWTLSGGTDVFEPFEYKAFRYAEIIAPPDSFDFNSIKAIVRHYPYDASACVFRSSDDMLNKIWEICRYGVVLGAQEVFVDCPQREKGQYLGDATVTALSHLYISGDSRLYKKALKDFALSSFICNGLMAVAPGSFMQEIADYSLQYPQQLLTYYNHTGDLIFLREMYPYALNCIKHFDRYKRKDGLLQNVTDKWNLVDWPDNLRDGYDFDLSKPVGKGCHNVINAFYISGITALNDIRKILGIVYIDNTTELMQAYQNIFYNDKSKLFMDAQDSKHSSLHANIMALYSNLAPDEAIDSIVALISKKRLSCGVYMAFFLLKALAKVDKYKLIYELITSDDEKSWGNMVIEGATTCFEAWGKEQKWNTSLCHPWASAPISILIEDIIGLKPVVAGWHEISLEPHIPDKLTNIELVISLPIGKVKIIHNSGKTLLRYI